MQNPEFNKSSFIEEKDWALAIPLQVATRDNPTNKTE